MIATRKPVIELRRLHRFFGRTKAVNDVSFEVYPGQVFGYIGPNGAGKTTSMRILATLDLPTAGDALIDGYSVINDPDRVRRRLGFMPDAFGVYANVNCREYLDFFARSYGLRGRERRLAMDRTMEFTGLDVLAEKPISGLSKGMKQRLCLGRSMIHDPAVMILDEPAAGLDPRARIELREMIARLAKDDKTILVSSHILTELAEMCDVVGIIEQGQLLATGSVADIQRGQLTHSRVRVRVLENTEGLANWLSEKDGYSEIVTDGELLHFSHVGERAEEAILLKEMIESGFRIAEFGARHSTLEDVFLNVTKGRVQ
ncbi:ABC transporter ATP-binding protein [Blastopirellula marina]|uniref:ABC transporter ATP-binding protein n=1 Tax=Blastopirellula marina TaxID=124 RepID=A0A2S8EZV6_9BACT|nr:MULTISPECIES: ABC transporter ATP-binding protein [Pirellulaceae]PQO25401.1 ABC transporter ATP-binding protein [Blastopirellula marina]RCS42365.1 ABC transporter ATP-binding protein [Bremerella cremea]